ncbi:hypothetical protein SLS60_010976, partial [Paraconiothyrium brasiliense]
GSRACDISLNAPSSTAAFPALPHSALQLIITKPPIDRTLDLQHKFTSTHTMPASSAPSSPSAPTKKGKAVVFEMDPNHLGYAKRSRTNLTIPQSSTDENSGEYKVLLIEYSSWEEKQQVELKQLRSTVALLSKEIADMREERSAKNTELRSTHQHNKSLELEKDNLHKKCDSLSRRADRWENAHNDFRPKLQEFEAQINKLVNEKHQATAMVLQEQSRNIEKNKEVRNLNRELNALAKSYQDLHKRHEQAIGRKNAPQEKSGYDLRSSADREKGPRVVKCTQCYTKKWPCDAGHPCQACIARGKCCPGTKSIGLRHIHFVLSLLF